MSYLDDLKKKASGVVNNVSNAVKQGTQLLENIDDAIALAKKVAMHYKCYTKIARVQ